MYVCMYVDMGSKYQDSLTFGCFFGGDGHTPYKAQACARVPERGGFWGLFSSIFFSTSLKQKKDFLTGRLA